jgi:cellulose synthase/poly-beta-1,6-N-acetylglucosamine synthase-like glycosyltransferase
MAFNEAANIGRLLDVLTHQRLDMTVIDEIVVVSSASTDGTDDIVEEWTHRDDRIRLVREPERRGKSAAINTFLARAKSEVVIVESADTLPAKTTVEKMVSAFADPKVGMVGGRPLPENHPDTFVGYAVNLLWKLHHRMALVSPKLGEMIAFRNLVPSIPEKSAVDEASIEAEIERQGFRLRYLPDAIVHNKGPENLTDFIKQRRRIATGHFWLQKQFSYRVSSSKPDLMLRLTLGELSRNPLDAPYLFGVMALEAYCRFLGWYDFEVRKQNPFTWDIARSTKDLKVRID